LRIEEDALKAMDLTGGDPSYGRKQRTPNLPPPAVPAGLGQLSPALKRLVDLFEIPASLIDAAAENSSEFVEAAAIDFRPLAAQLPREGCDEFLCRLAQGDTTAGMELRKRLLALTPPTAVTPEIRRSASELLKRADAIAAAREHRRKAEARKKHEAEMKALASREAETWQQVTSLVDLKQTKSYDEAVQLLAKLAQLAESRGSKDDYQQRVAGLCDRYKRLSGFRWRVERAKLLVDRSATPMDQDEQ